MSRKESETGVHPDLARAAENAEQRIRGLQNRLAGRSPAAGAEEVGEDLEAELRKYFAAETAEANLRSRVIEKVADRILERWDEESLVEELAEKILERIRAVDYARSAGSRRNS
jgi:hypothetical protein